jgi:hypothetical protein
VRKHIPFILITFVLSTDRKGLARGTAGNQFDAISPLVKINATHVFIEKTTTMPHALMPILCESLTRIPVTLDYRKRFKTGLMQTQRKPAAAGK